MCNEGLLFKLYFFLLMSRQRDIKHECFILGTSLCKVPYVSFTLDFSITVKSPFNVFLSGGMKTKN